jgi:hypothetical protein
MNGTFESNSNNYDEPNLNRLHSRAPWARAGNDFVRGELICFSRKHNLRQQPATNQPDGQITKNLSSPSRKNIPLSIRPKSVAFSALSRLDKRGGSRVVTNAGRDAVDAAASGAKRVCRAVIREQTRRAR